MKPDTRITSEKLILRELTPNDLDHIYNLCKQSKTGDWFERWDMDRDSAQSFLEWQIAKYTNYDVVNDTVSFGIELNKSNEFIGHCGIGKHEILHETEIFIGIERKYQNKGYGTEAVLSLTEWALSNFRIPYLCATILVDNLASQRIFEKSGYQFVKIKTIDYLGNLTPFRYYRKNVLNDNAMSAK